MTYILTEWIFVIQKLVLNSCELTRYDVLMFSKACVRTPHCLLFLDTTNHLLFTWSYSQTEMLI